MALRVDVQCHNCGHVEERASGDALYLCPRCKSSDLHFYESTSQAADTLWWVETAEERTTFLFVRLGAVCAILAAGIVIVGLLLLSRAGASTDCDLDKALAEASPLSIAINHDPWIDGPESPTYLVERWSHCIEEWHHD
jgi:hypothetical protein